MYGVRVHQRPAGRAGGTKGATQPQPQPQPPHEQKKVRDIELKELDPKEIKKVDEKIQTELKKLPKLNVFYYRY